MSGIVYNGQGANEYVDLIDTPSALSGDGLKVLRVNTGGTAIEHATGVFADEKVKVDTGATAGFLGAAYNDGVLRVDDTTIDLTDGGNFITLSVDTTKASNWDGAATHAALTSGNPHSVTPTELSLLIGTNTQAWDASLDSIAALAYVSGSFIALTGADTYTVRTYAQTLSDIGAQATDASLDSIAALAYVSGSFIALTGADTYTVRTYAQTLSDIGAQASDASLTSIAALTYASDSFIKVTAEDAYAIRTIAETKTDLSLNLVENTALSTYKLDDLATPDDNTDLDFSTSVHGLVPKGTNVGDFLRDDGTWASAGGGNKTSETKTAAYTLVAGDVGKTIEMDNAAARVFTLTAASTLGKGWYVTIVKEGAGQVQLDAAGSDTIADSTAGGTLTNAIAAEAGWANVTIEVAYDETKFIITGAHGTWVTA